MNSDSDIDTAHSKVQPANLGTARVEEAPSHHATSPAQVSAWYRQPWLWGLVVLLVVLAGVGAYLLMQENNNSTDNSVVETTADAEDGAAEAVAPEPAAASNPYEGWSTFTSRIEGFSFKYPATMTVEEILPTDKNDQGYDEGYTRITVMDKSQSGNNEYVFRISDAPWGCTGPGTWSLTYDVTIGEQAATLEETCGGLIASVTLGNSSEETILIADTQYLLEDEGDFDLILGSMIGVSLSN